MDTTNQQLNLELNTSSLIISAVMFGGWDLTTTSINSLWILSEVDGLYIFNVTRSKQDVYNFVAHCDSASNSLNLGVLFNTSVPFQQNQFAYTITLPSQYYQMLCCCLL